VVAGEPRHFHLRISPQNSEYRIDGGKWIRLSDGSAEIDLPPRTAIVEAKNPICCAPQRRTVEADEPSGAITLNLDFLPAAVIATCGLPGVNVRVAGRAAKLDNPSTIVLKDTMGSRRVEIEFFDDNEFYQKKVKEVHYNETVTVPCQP
jgi:hypothetical protein